MSTDLILYIIIVAVLIVWLRNTLGTRHGDERERPNPFSQHPGEGSESAKDQDKRGRILDMPDAGTAGLADQAAATATPRGLEIADKEVEEELARIARKDKRFEPVHFLEGARDAFTMIVESFAEGDRETLASFLAPQIYETFDETIRQREEKGEAVSTEIHAVREAKIIGATIAGKTAYITVRFTADETCVIRDSDGEITAGNPEKITEMVDVWVFGRKIGAKDPTWYLYETRDDVEEDHKTPLPEGGESGVE